MAHHSGAGWKGAAAAGMSLFPVCGFFFFCGLCKLLWLSLCPSQQGLFLLRTSEQITDWSGLPTDRGNLAGHRQLPGWGEWHCCLCWPDWGSLSVRRQRVPLRKGDLGIPLPPGALGTAFPLPVAEEASILVSEIGKFLLAIPFSFYT